MLAVNNEIILRKPEPKDIEWFYLYKNDIEVSNELVGFSSGYSYTDINEWIESKRKSNEIILWTIATKEDDRCIGHKGLYKIDFHIRMAETGMFIGDKKYWKKGIGTAIKKTVLNFAFDELNLHRIESRCLAGNVKAQKLNEKCGFKKEGVLRHYVFRKGEYLDIELWGLLDYEWNAIKNSFDSV